MLYTYDKKRSRYVKATRFYFRASAGLIGLSLLIYLGASLHLSSRLKDVESISEETRLLIINSEHKFSSARLKRYLIELNVKFPHIVYAQAKLESGNFKSPIFLENNNLFGMKVAKRRPTTNKGENRGHAYFTSWRDCVVDYAFYQAAYLNELRTEQQYLEYLKSNYAEDPNYYESLLKILRKKQK
jgi:hypothetical protein